MSHYADKILDHYQKLDNSVSRIQFEINEIFEMFCSDKERRYPAKEVRTVKEVTRSDSY